LLGIDPLTSGLFEVSELAFEACLLLFCAGSGISDDHFEPAMKVILIWHHDTEAVRTSMAVFYTMP
jgi:hypothetical protein